MIRNGELGYVKGINFDWLTLPPGTYTIIRLLSEIDEEQCKGIVEKAEYPSDPGYENYNPIHKYDDTSYDKALDSLSSFCKRHNITNPLILKRNGI